LVKEQLILMPMLATHLAAGGTEYLKMVGWTVIAWSKNREQLD
jgi:hypothetical protein